MWINVNNSFPDCCKNTLDTAARVQQIPPLLVFALQCTAQVNVDVLEVTMSGLAAADTDVYRCVAEILFPPPYLRFRANATLVHVIGKKKNKRHDMRICMCAAAAKFYNPRPSTFPTEKSECFVEPPHVQMAQSDDQEKENTPAISAPVGILAVLVLLVLFTIIILQVRALFYHLYFIIYYHHHYYYVISMLLHINGVITTGHQIENHIV